MPVLEALTNKKHEEVRCKISDVPVSSNEFTSAAVFLSKIFGKKMNMNASKDYKVSFSFVTNDNGIRSFTCTVRQTDSDVSESQLSLFSFIPDKNHEHNITEIKTRVSND